MSSPLVVIVGETASGKSDLAIKLAEYFDGEIICADSTTIYRDFNIGSAKPNQSDRQKIHHHLLDIADPNDDFNVAMFQRLAIAAINEISQRGNPAFLVGGSGLYIDSILYNFEFLPPVSVDRRDELNRMDLVELVKEADHLGLRADMVDTDNKRRLIRFIESNGTRPKRSPLRPNTLIIGLQIPKDDLQATIEQRVNSMITLGLEKEARKLAITYGWEVRPMQGIGYREWQGYVKGAKTLSEIHRTIIKDSLLLAKKQRVWFKRNKSIHWFSTKDKIDNHVDLITTFLNK